jgi:cell division protein ZapA
MNDNEVVSVEIMGKVYKIVCPKDKVDSLNEAALLLNTRIEETRKATGKVHGSERVAVMSALNIAHEFINISTSSEQVKTISRISQKLDGAISSKK